MLDFLRKRRRSWIITFFLVLIVVTFVLYYGGRSAKEPRLENVVEVNGEAIGQREFEIHYQRLVDFYRSLFKGGLTEETIKGLNLRGTVLEQLIQKRLLLQEARRLGLEVTEDELRDEIARIPDFQVNGRFNQSRYLQALRLNRLTPGEFERERQEQLTVQKLYDLIQDTVQVTEAEVRERYRLEQERINLYYIRLSAADFLTQVKVTEGEVKSHYERNKEAFREPLRVQVEYVTYPFDHFSAKLSVSEKEIEEYYKAHKETKFSQSKAVRVRHILFSASAGAGLKQKDAIRLKAEGVLKEARAGKDFARLAREFSEDPGAAKGGDAGWFTPGQMDPPFDKAAFALKKGGISNVIETPAGYHILKVEDLREEKTKGLQEVKAEIIRAIRAERGRNEAAKAAEADRDKAISGSDLSLLAKEEGIPYKVTPFFALLDKQPEGIPVEGFNKVAFSLALQEVSQPVEGANAYYLLRVKRRREPTIPPLGNVRSDIERRLKETQAFGLASQKAKTLMGQLQKEKEIKKLAKENGLVVEETGWFVRSAPEIPKIGVLQEAKPGGISVSSRRPIPDRIYTQKTNVYLLAFKESQGADMERFEQEKARLQEEALMGKRQRTVQKFVDALKAKARIAVKSQFLEES